MVFPLISNWGTNEALLSPYCTNIKVTLVQFSWIRARNWHLVWHPRQLCHVEKKLTQLEMETLFDQLFACEQPYADPLKKPTITYLPLDEIRSRFR